MFVLVFTSWSVGLISPCVQCIPGIERQKHGAVRSSVVCTEVTKHQRPLYAFMK
jgi:hypothetical protein